MEGASVAWHEQAAAYATAHSSRHFKELDIQSVDILLGLRSKVRIILLQSPDEFEVKKIA